MSNLLVVDVFESYYEGRKTPFPAEGVELVSQARREDRKPFKDAKAEQPMPLAG